MAHEDVENQDLYVLQDGETLGPYTRDQLASMISDGSMDSESLVKIGPQGKVFSAAILKEDMPDSEPRIRRSPK
jgi:hypothetical protein